MFSLSQSTAEENNETAKKDVSDVSKDDSTGLSNEVQIKILVSADTSSPQEQPQDNVATKKPRMTQKTTDKKDRAKKTNFGGLKKGFLL